MMKSVASFSIILLFIFTLNAQNGSMWEPQIPVSGDTITIYFDPAQNAGIPNNTTSLVLHWGVNEFSPGEWQQPDASLWPEGTVKWNDGKAVRSPMTKVGNIWQISVRTDQTIRTLHYVVNTGTPSVAGPDWGKNTGDKNWDITLTAAQIGAVFLQPEVINRYGDLRRSPAFVTAGNSLSIVGTAEVSDTDIDSLFLYIDTVQVAATGGDTLYYLLQTTPEEGGFRDLHLIASDKNGIRDTVRAVVMINAEIVDVARPAGIKDGINYKDANTVLLSLYAPSKEYVYVIGDFNDWQVNSKYYMQRDSINTDSIHWWVELTDLTTGTEYAFQYLVDGKIRIADPYTEKVLDPWHDQEITDRNLYPNLKPYPQGKTSEPVAVLQTNKFKYNWQNSESYQRPQKHELVVYELLMRDFLEHHAYSTLIDTLDYLQEIGINAIELMPVNEFEGNSSWGYNPSFYFAPDKYYGPADSLKAFIDACHGRGMAVIIDMVLNHSFGQSPLVRLYATEQGWPSAQNPWYYPDYDPAYPGYQARHPYNVGYDFDHTNAATKALVDRINRYWLEEYQVDGFRFDLTKGLTSDASHYHGSGNYSDNGAYDAARIAILKRMADQIWANDMDAMIILEHFADNTEEKELSSYKSGMMLWGNTNYNYNEATMGYHDNNKSNFSWGYYVTRGWSKPHLVTYMESHDEERLMFKNLAYGNSSGNYSIQELAIALNRMKMAGAFFFTLPGPKMLWQFGELGYNYSINYPSGNESDRLTPKPIRWDYFQDIQRRNLYKTYAALLKLRKEAAAFRSPDAQVELDVAGPTKKIKIFHASTRAVIIGNFDVVATDVEPGFIHSGPWYDYFSGESMMITDSTRQMHLLPGEFHIYTDVQFEKPEDDILNDIADLQKIVTRSFQLDQNYPNPFNPVTEISFSIPEKAEVTLKIFDILGRDVFTVLQGQKQPGFYSYTWTATNNNGLRVGSGVYYYQLKAKAGGKLIFTETRKMVLLK